MIETKHYSDGTSATGTAPLPDLSPDQQAALEGATISFERKEPQTTYEAAGTCRVVGSLTEKRHPADGMTATVHVGDGAAMTIVNSQSFEDGGPAWTMTWGNPESIRHSVASLLESYDYLLSGAINTTEATRRLRLLRAARRSLCDAE